MTETDFEARAVRNNNQQVSLTNGTKVPASQILYLEPMPGSTAIQTIEVLDANGVVLGRLTPTKNGFQIPRQPPAQVRISLTDGTKIDWNAAATPPSGYRLAISPSKPFQEAGFSGGHTREAWTETMRTYGDKVKIVSEQKLGFRVPGDATNFEVAVIRYDFDGKSVSVPKTIFEGSGSGSLSRFEQHIARTRWRPPRRRLDWFQSRCRSWIAWARRPR
jgi:hypothetical protein